MKNILLPLFVLLFTITVFAQVPQSLNYQAVARNAAGNALMNSSVAVRISIHDSAAGGPVIYSERDTATTNAFGLFSCKVGAGNTISGTFSAINWASAPKFMEVDLDPTGGSSYVSMGTTQLVSVPYALHARNAYIADTVLHGGSSEWAASGSSIYNANTGSVGIGTARPGYISNSKFDVVGKVVFRTVPSDSSKFLTFDEIGGVQRIYTDASPGTASDFILGTYPNGHFNQLVLQQSTGYVGIGTATPAARLDVAGNIKIADGTQGLGRVLTSDANGVATWDKVNTFSESQCASNTYFTVAGTVYNYSCGQVTITVNRPGTVMVTATANVGVDHLANELKRVMLNIGTTATDGGVIAENTWVSIPSSYPAFTTNYSSYMVRRTFTITTPGTYTYYLNGSVTVGTASGNDNYNFSHMEAVLY